MDCGSNVVRLVSVRGVSMKKVYLVAVGLAIASLASSSHADVLDPSGGGEVAFLRNTSAVAAGLIAAALAVGMARLRRYGVKRTY